MKLTMTKVDRVMSILILMGAISGSIQCLSSALEQKPMSLYSSIGVLLCWSSLAALGWLQPGLIREEKEKEKGTSNELEKNG